MQTLIQESIHSTQSNRILFRPLAEAFGLLSGEQLPSAECKRIS